jgi:glyoxylase-like metal-dependent hydrolase (beta-lactamase superfamily II)
MQEIAQGIALVPTLIANAYLVGDPASWVLVDACIPGREGLIRRAVERRFGAGSRPSAILLTHGHFDHAGSAAPLSDLWHAPIYAHPLEIPYITGSAEYPPFDYSSPGFFTRIARFFPTRTVNLGTRVHAFDPQKPIPGLPEWEIVETPGHTPGHISFFRRRDAALIAGDAVTTMNLDSFFETITRYKSVGRPPVPATMNWSDARRSVQLLATLRPALIAAGHGLPMQGAAEELVRLAKDFPMPPMAQSAG